MQLSNPELYIFTDVSLIAYGAIAFICVDGDNGQN